MNLLVSLLKNQKITIAIGIILLIALIFIFGRKLGLTTTEQILISALVLLLYFIWYLFTKMQEAKNAGNIEQSIGAQADNQIQNMRPEKKAEIEQFKKQLEAAINSLKKSKLGRGKLGKSALYALPWYMFIGPPAAGKTTAIQNSGLEFPFGNRGLKGVGGTRNCDWFFSNKAIFLDTAGRYTTEVEDRQEWISFLEVLKKNRKKKPINGVLIGIGIDEIISAEQDTLMLHANNIRQRIDELIEHLSIRFPVYLIFTKCDLLQGFIEYFGDFSHSERCQIWGTTFSRTQQSSSNLRDIFNQGFEKLYSYLSSMQRSRLSLPLKREQRRRVYLFPQQFDSIKDKLLSFVDELFQQNPYQDSPIFRGFYFTSGTQEGIPLNIAIEKIAKQFDLPSLSEEESESEFEIKNYFIKDLFTKVVINDQDYLVGKTSQVSKQKRIFRFAAITISTIFFGLFVLGIFQDYISSQMQMNQISDKIVNVRNVDWNTDLLQAFKKTDELRTIVEEITREQYESNIFNWGIDKSSDILEPLRKLYFNKTSPFLNKYIFEQLERKLGSFTNGNQYPREQMYNTLKAYLLIGEESTRLDSSNKAFLLRELYTAVDSRILQLIPSSASSDRETLRELMHKHLEYVIKNLGVPGTIQFRNDSYLVKNVRQLIKIVPSIGIIYNNIKQTGFETIKELFDLKQVEGISYSSSISCSFEIPGFFTKKGWNSFVRNEISKKSKNPRINDWVIGINEEVIPEVTYDEEVMNNKLQQLYFKEYNEYWLKFLENIRYTDFGNVSSASQIMNNLKDQLNSPLYLIMSKVTEETKFENEFEKVTIDTNLQIGNSNSTHPVDREFAKFHNFVLGESNDGGLGKISKCFEQYAYIWSALENLKGDGEACKNYSLMTLKQSTGEFHVAVKEIQSSLYPSLINLKNIFSTPIKYAWQSIMKDTQEYLNTQWQQRVSQYYYRTLANYYPFNKEGMDAPLQDFEDFFKPDYGMLWTFFNDEFDGFVNKDTWKTKNWLGIGINFSENLINALAQANDISKTMFKGGILKLSFQMRPSQPISRPIRGNKPIVEQIYININGFDNKYHSGSPYWIDFDWPANRGMAKANLIISIRGYKGSVGERYPSEWAMFRLFGDANINRKSPTLYQISWNFNKENLYDIIITYDLLASSANNPFKKGYLNSFKLPKAIN